MLLYTGWHKDIRLSDSRQQTAEGCIPESRRGNFAAYKLIAAKDGDTTTLGPQGPIKLKNPWAGRPINLKNLLSSLHLPFKKINMPQNAVVWYT